MLAIHFGNNRARLESFTRKLVQTFSDCFTQLFSATFIRNHHQDMINGIVLLRLILVKENDSMKQGKSFTNEGDWFNTRDKNKRSGFLIDYRLEEQANKDKGVLK